MRHDAHLKEDNVLSVIIARLIKSHKNILFKGKYVKFTLRDAGLVYDDLTFMPISDMPISCSSDSAANKDMMTKI